MNFLGSSDGLVEVEKEKKAEGWGEDDDDWGELEEEETIVVKTPNEGRRVEPKMKFGKPDEQHVSWDEDDELAGEEEPWTGWDDIIQVCCAAI